MSRRFVIVIALVVVLPLVFPFTGGGRGLIPLGASDVGTAAQPVDVPSAPAAITVAAIAPVALAASAKLAPVVTDGSSWVGADGSYRSYGSAAVSGGGCPGNPGGGGGAPGAYSAQGVAGTTSDDLSSFAWQYNAIRAANCLEPLPAGNFYYDSCMEARLFWMAESPSPDPMDAWGHMGSVRIDGVPSPGCDGNLAGGSGNSGATVAQKWWDSASHRASLYRPGSGVGGVCIAFAMTHGGIDEPYSFTRAAARWTGC